MELASAITGLKHAEVMGQVQVRVAKKILDQERANGSSALMLLEAATKGMHQAGDALAAAATGLGGHVDTYA